MHLGILQTGIVPEELAGEHGTYFDMFNALLDGHDFAFTNYAVVDGVFPDSVHEHDGWLITGSRHGAYEDHPWIPPLETFIRDVRAAEIPMVGVCFGHQIMAQALGGKVIKFGGLWGVGCKEYERPDGSTIRLLAMHQDQVVVKPPEADVLLQSDLSRYAALSYSGKAISFQPHPEFSVDFMRGLIESRIGTAIPEEQALPALETLDLPNDSSTVALEIAEFFKSAKAAKAA